MKIKKNRAAISQSMDLFIIIAAVLGVGGVVTASIYNLVSSATTSTSIIVVGAAMRAGGAASNSPSAVSISVKNNGGSPITCTPSTCQVVFAGTNTGTATPPACAAPCSITSGGPAIWTIGGPAGEPETNYPLTFETDAFTLQPGGQTSFVLNAPLSSVGTSPTFWAVGASITINVLFGSTSAQVVVTSQ
jgi:hypothetical protein